MVCVARLVIVSVVLVLVAALNVPSPAYEYVIVYGVVEAASPVVGNAVLNVPFAPMVAVFVTEPIAMETVSPDGGNCPPEVPITPLRLIDVVVEGIVCDGVRLLNDVMTPLTVNVAIDKIC